MHTNEVSQKPNLPAMTTRESDAGASMTLSSHMAGLLVQLSPW